MSEDATYFAFTDVCVPRDFMRGHSSTKTNDNPLDGFRNRLTPRHGGSETSYQLCPLMATPAESRFGSTKLHVDTQPWLRLSQKYSCTCITHYRVYLNFFEV